MNGQTSLLHRLEPLTGKCLRVSGFQTLLLCLLLVPALLAHDVSLEVVTAKYFQLMTATILLALLAAVGAFAASYGEHTKHPVTGHH